MVNFTSARLNQRGELTLRLNVDVPVIFKNLAFSNQSIEL